MLQNGSPAPHNINPTTAPETPSESFAQGSPSSLPISQVSPAPKKTPAAAAEVSIDRFEPPAVVPAINARARPDIDVVKQRPVETEKETGIVPVSDAWPLKLHIVTYGRGSNGRIKARANRIEKRDKRLERIIMHIHEHGCIRNEEIVKLLRVSDATATRYAQILIDRGLICIKGRGRSTHYRYAEQIAE